MANGAAGQDTLEQIAEDAFQFGAVLSALFEASTFSAEEKNKLKALVPFMDVDELSRLERILRRNLEESVAEDAEDLMLAFKGAQLKHEFAIQHAEHNAVRELAAIEREIDELER